MSDKNLSLNNSENSSLDFMDRTGQSVLEEEISVEMESESEEEDPLPYSPDILNEKNEENYFIKARKKLKEMMKEADDLQNLQELNIYLNQVANDCKNDVEATRVILHLENQQRDIEDGVFIWVYQLEELKIIHPFIKFFKTIKDLNKLRFLNLEKFREILPIRYFQNYFNNPFHSAEDTNLWETIHSFHSDLLSVFDRLYLRSFMSKRPVIDAEKIISIDPYMRMTIRKENISYYINNFPEANKFDLYFFIKKIMETFTLSGAPRWKMEKGTPLFVPLFRLINGIFKYGLVSLDYVRDMLSLYYLICESIASLERKISNEVTNDSNLKKYQKEFIRCRENAALVMIQTIAIFSDVSLEETQINYLNEQTHIEIFEKFLFKEKAAFNYFSHVVLKYLSQGVKLGNLLINSPLLKESLTLIFNFIGDYQNDIFKLSMDLINKNNFQYYMKKLKDDENFLEETMQTDISFIVQQTIDFIDEIKNYSKKLDVIESFLNYFTNIEKIIFQYQDNVYFKLEMAKENIPALMLNIIDFADKDKKIKTNDIIKSLLILKSLLQGEFVNQGVLFRGKSQKNFESLSRKRNFLILLMIKEVFKDNPYLLFISPKMFDQNLMLFREFLTDIIVIINNKQDTLESRTKVMRIYFFNEYFFNLLETHLIKIKRRKKFDIMLTQEMYKIFSDYGLEYFKILNNLPLDKLKDLKLESDLSDMNLNNVRDTYKKIQKVDFDVLLVRFFFKFFKLFTKTVYRSYSGKVYQTMFVRLDNLGGYLKEMTFKYTDSILLRLEYVKLYDRIRVFFPNHLITERAKYNPSPTLIIGEVFIPSNFRKITNFIKNEFVWYEKYMAFHQNKNEEVLVKIRKYLIKGLIALIFKFLKGIEVHISILIDKTIIKKLRDVVDEIVDILDTKYTQLERLLAPKNNLLIPNKQQRKSMIKKKNGLKEIENRKQEYYTYIEEKPFEVFISLRKSLDRGLFIIKEAFEDEKFNYLIKRYQRERKIPKRTQFMKSNLSSSLTFDNLKQLNHNNNKIQNKTNSLDTFFNENFKPLKSNYKIMKSYFNQYPEENQFLKILNDFRDINSIKTFLNFFIDQIGLMELEYATNKHELEFLNNDYFIYFFIIVDNLILMNPSIRIAFLEILKNEKPGGPGRKMLQKSWRCFITLYLIVMYKTFMDEEWEEYWSKFCVISNFFQNLCEGNCHEFKLFLNSKDCPGAISFFTTKRLNQKDFTIFFELYIILETSANFTNFWLNKSGEVLPSDKSEIFMIIKRLFDHTLEHLTGPCLKNQLKIYVFRIDIWTGIIVRVVDDTDSDFYHVKKSCLDYISSLLEGINNEIIMHMGSNLQIHVLFELMIRLLKKLYIRVKRKIKFKSYDKNINTFKNTEMISNIKEIEENEFPVRSFSLLSFYKMYKEDFSDHVLMEVIIGTFFLIKKMSFKVKFWHYYLKEKQLELRSLNKVKDKNLKETLYMFRFIQQITSNVEIVYENKIQRVLFKKEPKCFLLSLQTRMDFEENIDFTSLQSKHIDLFDKIPQFNLEMEYNRSLFEKYGYLYTYATNDFYYYGQIMLYLFSILLNILMIVYFEAVHEEADKPVSKFFVVSSTGNDIIKIVALVIIVFSAMLCVSWISLKLTLEVEIKMVKLENTRRNRIISVITAIWTNPRFVSYFFHFVFTLIGITYYNWFYTLNLLLLTNLSETINYINKSILKHYEKLIITLIVTVLLIFSYTFLFLQYFTEKINTGDFGDHVCLNYVNCFMNSLNMGVRFGGGLSDFLEISAKPDEGRYWGRFFFDISYFFLIQMIALNIFAGIIIDTFGEMRDLLTERRDHKYNKCSICGLDRWQIEKDGQNFGNHKRYVHNLWEYLYFMIRINSVSPKSFNGIEFVIWEHLKNDETEWLPKYNFLKHNENYKEI